MSRSHCPESAFAKISSSNCHRKTERLTGLNLQNQLYGIRVQVRAALLVFVTDCVNGKFMSKVVLAAASKHED
jgi:hypothetical protein